MDRLPKIAVVKNQKKKGFWKGQEHGRSPKNKQVWKQDLDRSDECEIMGG